MGKTGSCRLIETPPAVAYTSLKAMVLPNGRMAAELVPALVKVQCLLIIRLLTLSCVDLPQHFITLLYMFTLALALALLFINRLCMARGNGYVVDEVVE